MAKRNFDRNAEAWITGIGIVSSLGEGPTPIGMRSTSTAINATTPLRPTSCIRWRR